MECKHEQFYNKNCVYYCMKCGREIPNPYEKKEEEKKPAKRRTKKGDEKA